MREKLKALGVGNELTIWGQYCRVSSDYFLMKNIHHFDTGTELCNHLWIPQYGIDAHSVFWLKEHNDFFVGTGEIYEYEKGWRYGYSHDYGIKRFRDIRIIRPLVFREELVFLRKEAGVQYDLCRYELGYYSSFENQVFFETDQVRHLWVEYQVKTETDQYYDLFYEKRSGPLRVYKTLEACMERMGQ